MLVLVDFMTYFGIELVVGILFILIVKRDKRSIDCTGAYFGSVSVCFDIQYDCK